MIKYGSDILEKRPETIKRKISVEARERRNWFTSVEADRLFPAQQPRLHPETVQF